ncbi:MAG: hypothetical protein ACO37V_04985, partial [Ilumatobacteraceae bacterium]
MATTVVLNQATLTVDSVDFSDQVSTITVTESYEALESTAFGDTARKFVKGLGNHEISATLMIAYGTSEVEEKLNSLAGTTFDVVVTPTTSATPGVSNPEYTLSGAYLESVTPVNGGVGELP